MLLQAADSEWIYCWERKFQTIYIIIFIPLGGVRKNGFLALISPVPPATTSEEAQKSVRIGHRNVNG